MQPPLATESLSVLWIGLFTGLSHATYGYALLGTLDCGLLYPMSERLRNSYSRRTIWGIFTFTILAHLFAARVAIVPVAGGYCDSGTST